MLSLLSELHFWTLRDAVSISNADFGTFRFYDKKSNEDTTAYQGKKLYAEKRGHLWAPQNKRPIRIKENLKELEEHLTQQRLVLCQWRDCSLLQLMFSSGLFVNIAVNTFTGDPVLVTLDKFFIGKLLSDYVADVVITKSHLICSYNDAQLTLVYFAKPTLKRSSPKSFSHLDPRIYTIDLAGPAGRRLERKLACNVSGDMIVVWWHSSHGEVYPWSPVVKDQDRANILVYGISGQKADLLCHHRSEFDLLSVSFSEVHSNVVRTVEQKVSRNGDVTIESSSYQISRGTMQRTLVASIALPTHVCCHHFSPLQDKLLMGCIDGSLVLHNEALGVTHMVKAAYIPSIVSWHPDGGIFVVANERCQIQIYDAALATLKQQLLTEDVTPGNLLDITSYFHSQPILRSIKWNRKADTNFYGEKFAVQDCLLLLSFERGPLAALRFVGGGGLLKDIHGTGGYSFDSLVAQYLWANQVDRAINLLLTLNWDVSGSTCLSCLQRIVNHLFKLPLTPNHEVQIQCVLGSFHMPVRPMCPATIDEFKAPVKDLTRRFFHQLLRYKLFEKAFRLAIDLMDHDLFIDIYFSAKNANKKEIADAAFKKAEELETSSYASSTSESAHSKCSQSSCSECSESTSMVSDSEDQELVSHGLLLKQEPPKLETEKQNQTTYLLESKQKFTQYRPPLPVSTNLTSGNINYQHIENSAPVVAKSLPVMWKTHSVGFPQNVDGSETPHNHKSSSESPIDEGLQSARSSRSLPAQSERPKVKFCETVTQITLPDRLHTLLEEEEDHQSPSKTSPLLSPNSLNFRDRKDDSFLSQNTTHLSSFSQSANSVGIPIVPATQQRAGLSERRKIHLYELQMASHPLSRVPPVVASSSPSITGPSIQWMSGEGSRPQTVHPNCLLPSTSAFYHDVVNASPGSPKTDPNRTVEFSDSLETDELSALLPGSRKPLTSNTNTFERSLSTSSVPNGSHKSNSIESPYFINYSGTFHDVSEEEENNGSIKIVHFGVV